VIDEEGRPILRQVRGDVDDLGDSAHRTSRGFRAAQLAWAAMAAAMAAGVYSVARLSSEAITAASNLEEVQNKFSVVFSDQIELAEQWVDTLVDSYLMCTREAKQYLSSIQDLLVPMGMQRDAAGELSFEIVKLAADLGSFDNLPTEQVMLDIQSALVGNYETMKKYGVVLTATTVQERALAMGLAETKKELTAAQKAYAAYLIMLEDSEAAVGDVARSSHSYANQLKQLRANMEEIKTLLGQELLPYITDIVTSINTWIKVNDELIRQDIKTFFEGVASALNSIRWWLDPAYRQAQAIAREIGNLKEQLKELEGAGRELAPGIAAGLQPFMKDADTLRAKIKQLETELEQIWIKSGELTAAGPRRTAPALPPGGGAPPPPPPGPGGEGGGAAETYGLGIETLEREAAVYAELCGWELDLYNLRAQGVDLVDIQVQKNYRLIKSLGDLAKAQQLQTRLEGAVAGAIAASILGYEELGPAVAKATAQVIAALAAESIVQAIVETAKGFAALAMGNAASASAHFQSAALYAAVGAVAGAAAAGLQAAGGGAGAGETTGYTEARGASVAQMEQETTAPERPRAVEQNFYLYGEVIDGDALDRFARRITPYIRVAEEDGV
jgi:hypothetical protein